jgi:hypothetical protein
MDKLNSKTKRDRDQRISKEDRKPFEHDKKAKRPGLDNDAVFEDSASSIDVCI